METTRTPDNPQKPIGDINRFLDSVPSPDVICQRLDEIDREKKALRKLLRIAHAKDVRREVAPC